MPLQIPTRLKEHLEIGDKVWLRNEPDRGQGEIIMLGESHDGVPMYFVEFSKTQMTKNGYYKEKQLCECNAN